MDKPGPILYVVIYEITHELNAKKMTAHLFKFIKLNLMNNKCRLQYFSNN